MIKFLLYIVLFLFSLLLFSRFFIIAKGVAVVLIGLLLAENYQVLDSYLLTLIGYVLLLAILVIVLEGFPHVHLALNSAFAVFFCTVSYICVTLFGKEPSTVIRLMCFAAGVISPILSFFIQLRAVHVRYNYVGTHYSLLGRDTVYYSEEHEVKNHLNTFFHFDNAPIGVQRVISSLLLGFTYTLLLFTMLMPDMPLLLQPIVILAFSAVFWVLYGVLSRKGVLEKLFELMDSDPDDDEA